MKQYLELLALLSGEPINVGYLIFENIKNMNNAAQRACGHLCAINELCRTSRVPTYPDDEMIGPKAPTNVSEILRLQHNHPAEAAQ